MTGFNRGRQHNILKNDNEIMLFQASFGHFLGDTEGSPGDRLLRHSGYSDTRVTQTLGLHYTQVTQQTLINGGLDGG